MYVAAGRTRSANRAVSERNGSCTTVNRSSRERPARTLPASGQVTAGLLAIVLTIMPSMLFSGFIFQVHTMPTPMQAYANVFPARYFIDISRALALKGQGFSSVAPAMGFLAAYAAGLILLSSLRFKKRIG